jgi:hypothetical protein
MFMKMAEQQSAVVQAIRQAVPRHDWSRLYVHVEFRDEDGFLILFKEGFLVVEQGGRARREPLLIESAADREFEALHSLYAQAKQGFWRLDLYIESSGAYRFELDDRPSQLLAGEPDPEARGRLDRRFAELVEVQGRRT